MIDEDQVLHWKTEAARLIDEAILDFGRQVPLHVEGPDRLDAIGLAAAVCREQGGKKKGRKLASERK